MSGESAEVKVGGRKGLDCGTGVEKGVSGAASVKDEDRKSPCCAARVEKGVSGVSDGFCVKCKRVVHF